MMSRQRKCRKNTNKVLFNRIKKKEIMSSIGKADGAGEHIEQS